VAIEGLDASGKSTQTALLAEALAKAGLRVANWSFPRYESFFGQQIKQLLAGSQETSAATLDPSSMALWFANDRWDAINTMDAETMAADVILLNRWTLSNAVYQGARAGDEPAQDAMFDWVLELEYGRLNLPQPSVTVVIEVSVQTSMERAEVRAAQLETSPDVYESSARLLTDSRRLYRRADERFASVKRLEVDALGRTAVHTSVLEVVSSALNS
jgi:dTMP kinase